MHGDYNFKLVRIIYTMREKKNVCKHVVESYTIYLKILIQLNKIEKVNNIMWACQGVNLLLLMMTDLNTALFSSSCRLTEPKISRFSEIVSGIRLFNRDTWTLICVVLF